METFWPSKTYVRFCFPASAPQIPGRSPQKVGHPNWQSPTPSPSAGSSFLALAFGSPRPTPPTHQKGNRDPPQRPDCQSLLFDKKEEAEGTGGSRHQLSHCEQRARKRAGPAPQAGGAPLWSVGGANLTSSSHIYQVSGASFHKRQKINIMVGSAYLGGRRGLRVPGGCLAPTRPAAAAAPAAAAPSAAP